MKPIYKAAVITAVSILLEIFFFNFQTVAMLVDVSLEKNMVYTSDDVTYVNWDTAQDGSYISREDPQILIPTSAMKMNIVEISFQAEPADHTCVFFGTDREGTIFSMETQSLGGYAQFPVNQWTAETVRVDIGDYAGTVLSGIVVTVNPAKFHISFSRIVAIILIYLSGSMLFRIQRMPNYGIEEQLAEKEDQKP